MKTLIIIRSLIKTLSDKVKSLRNNKVKTRYFLVSYSFKKDNNLGIGSSYVSCNGYVNMDHFRQEIKKSYGDDVNPLISNIIELSKEDYETYKSEDNGK